MEAFGIEADKGKERRSSDWRRNRGRLRRFLIRGWKNDSNVIKYRILAGNGYSPIPLV